MDKQEHAIIPMERYNELLKKEKELAEGFENFTFWTTSYPNVPGWQNHFKFPKTESMSEIKKLLDSLSEGNQRISEEKEKLFQETIKFYKYRQKWWFKFFNYFTK